MELRGSANWRKPRARGRLWWHHAVLCVGGTLVGGVATLYAWLIDIGHQLFLAASAHGPWVTLLLSPALGALAVWLTHRYFDGAEGSGIPQIVAIVSGGNGTAKPRLLRPAVIVGKIGLSFLGTLGGFTLGRQGPTVHIGAALLVSLRRWLPGLSGPAGAHLTALDRQLALAGASAGLSAAFCTPLAGIAFAIEELARGKYAALTYEPSALPDGTLAHARGGTGNYSITITGKSAHAGRNPHDGRNAIVAASDLVLRIKALEAGDITVNPAKIEGGSANNVVPDLAILRFNIRPQSTDAMNRFDGQLDAILDAIRSEREVAIHRHGGVTRPPKPVDARAQKLFDLVKTCGAELGQQIGWKSTGGVCDGNNIAATGVPVVDTMGVRGGAIHSPDEFMIVPSLRERAALSALVLARLSTGDPL